MCLNIYIYIDDYDDFAFCSYCMSGLFLSFNHVSLSIKSHFVKHILAVFSFQKSAIQLKFKCIIMINSDPRHSECLNISLGRSLTNVNNDKVT